MKGLILARIKDGMNARRLEIGSITKSVKEQQSNLAARRLHEKITRVFLQMNYIYRCWPAPTERSTG